MPRYLVVAYQTIISPELFQRLSELAAADRQSTFTFLIPALPPPGWGAAEERDASTVAREKGEEAQRALSEKGVNVIAVKVGDVSPTLAVEDELHASPAAYDAIVLSTFPLGVSRWLRMDVHTQIERRSGLPVIHIEAPRHWPWDPRKDARS